MIKYLEKGEVIQKGDKVWFGVADDGDFYDINPNRIGEHNSGDFPMIREVADLNSDEAIRKAKVKGDASYPHGN